MFRNKHRRSQSDFVGPSFGFGLSGVQNQKSPDARPTSRILTSPMSSSIQADISHPQAVNQEQLEQFSKNRLSTMQMMYQQAILECEELKVEYQKKPSEINHTHLETKVKVLRRLESQISQHGGEPEGFSDKRFSRRGSGIEGYSAAGDGDKDLTTRPPTPPPHVLQPKRKSTDGGVTMTGRVVINDATKQEVSLARSHSDSYRQIRKKAAGFQLRYASSTDEIQKLCQQRQQQAMSGGDYLTRSEDDDESRSRSKSQDVTSDDSSDPNLNRLAMSSDTSHSFADHDSSSSDNALKRQSNIIAIDDYEFASEDEDFQDMGSPFSDFSLLHGRPAHLAVFLHYLISNSDPYPLLFYLVAENYSLGSGKELRKWAYEIISSFLLEKAPLRVKVEDSCLELIDEIISTKHDREDVMRGMFTAARDAALNQINDLLVDFRSKRALGLGGLYGDHELKDGLDRVAEMKIVENVLWRHFDNALSAEECERSQVMASALATFFKLVGCTNVKSGQLLERCATFNTKDRTRFMVFSKTGKKDNKVVFHRGHHLQPQTYYALTNCHLCQNALVGIAHQGYQCQKCELNFHKYCLEKIEEPCSGKRPSRPPTVFDKLIKKQSFTMPAAGYGLEGHMARTVSMPSIRDAGRSVPSSRPSFLFRDKNRGLKANEKNNLEKLSEEKLTNLDDFQFLEAVPNDEHQHDVDATSPPSYYSSISFSAQPSSDNPPSYFSLNVASDSDLDVEPELPPLEAVIAKEQLKKLDKKEKKRQDVINELFYTERAHVRNLKVMKQLFFLPMRNESHLVELADFVFPNIDEMIDVHRELNKGFRLAKKTSENGVVGDVSEILVQHFSGVKCENFKRVCGEFCKKQTGALAKLKAKQRKEPKLASLLQDAASNPHCRRLELKDLLPTAMQRLTKYPLLIDNLIKYSATDSEESKRLQAALVGSRTVLSFVNKTVSEYENNQKLVEIQKKLDRRPIENSTDPVLVKFKNLDLRNQTLIFDGPLTWRIGRERAIPLHVVLLDSVILLLQKQDDRLVLRTQSHPTGGDAKNSRSPIITLSNLMLRTVATDRFAFFIVIVSGVGPQIYELVAASRDEKNKWWKYITDAVEANRGSESNEFSKLFDSNLNKTLPTTNLTTNQTNQTNQMNQARKNEEEEMPQRQKGLEAIYDEEEEMPQRQKGLDAIYDDENEEEENVVEMRRETADEIRSDADFEESNDRRHLRRDRRPTSDTFPSTTSANDDRYTSTDDAMSESLDPLEQLRRLDEVIYKLISEKKTILSKFCDVSWPTPLSSDKPIDEAERGGTDSRILLRSMMDDADQLACLINDLCMTPTMLASNGDVVDSETASYAQNKELPIIYELLSVNESFRKKLTILLKFTTREEEEKQKLLFELESAREKLTTVLELPRSSDEDDKEEQEQEQERLLSSYLSKPPQDDDYTADLLRELLIPSHDDDVLAGNETESSWVIHASDDQQAFDAVEPPPSDIEFTNENANHDPIVMAAAAAAMTLSTVDCIESAETSA